MIKVNTLVISNDDNEVIDIIHGNSHNLIMTNLKDNAIYEEVLEDCSNNQVEVPSTIEALLYLYKGVKNFQSRISFTLFMDKEYIPSRKK